MLYFMGLAFALGLGVPIAAAGAGMGQGRAAAGALEGMARQPAMHGLLQISMIISLAFMESLVIFSLLVFFLMSTRLPDTERVLKTVEAQTTVAR